MINFVSLQTSWCFHLEAQRNVVIVFMLFMLQPRGWVEATLMVQQRWCLVQGMGWCGARHQSDIP